jgi:peptidoglycan/LPS O-acetylase OafA/YrhL
MQALTRTRTQIARRHAARPAESVPDAGPAVAGPPIAGLPDRPGIDGLRALAVAAVVIADAGAGWVTGGFVGIEMFLVITGFLITSLLLLERRSRGRIDLVRFWGRRARRALPALLTVIGGVSLFVLAARPDELSRMGGEVRAVLVGLSNWLLVADARGAAPEASTPSLLQHLWSLSVGAQFLVCWPVVLTLLLARVGRTRLRAIAWLLALGSVVAMGVLSLTAAPPRVVYGTDTRAAGLLIGAGLALAFPPAAWAVRASGARARRLRVLGLLVLASLVAATVMLPRSDAVLRGGLFLVAVLTALLIAVTLRSEVFDRLLGALPLRWLGLRSYGVYLWHWPVLIALGGPSALVRPELSAAYIGLTILLADLTYRFIEMPLCQLRHVRGSGRAGRPSLAVQAMAVACGVATVAALLVGDADPAGARGRDGGPPAAPAQPAAVRDVPAPR